MKAVNIDWDIDERDLTDEVLDYATDQEIAELLGTEAYQIKNMNEDDLYDLVRDAFHHRPGLMDDYLGLPSAVEIPEGMEEEEIADWLTEKYEYCLRGFDLIQ